MSSTSLQLFNMEKINLHYSTKNIPIASERRYKLKLIEKIEAVIKRMRWKAIFFEIDENDETIPETYGFKTKHTPSQVKEMIEFEKELIDIIRHLKFNNNDDAFQAKLKEDIKTINQSDKVYVRADKTNNIYKLSKTEYDGILTNSITSTYKKSKRKIENVINQKGKEILKDQPVLSRMNINGQNNCFVTLKDHKENFNNNPTTRLINPAKNELGRISKVILQKINKNIRNSLQINQWNSSGDVIEWFTGIQDKHLNKFMLFDVKDFYPSINESLLKDSLRFAETLTDINDKEKEIIHHSRKSLLFNNRESWMKKGGKLFDVTMGAYDGAEVCELVGCYILSIITNRYDKRSIGLYRDDGLAAFKNLSGPQAEKIKKDFQKIFKENGLEIVIQCNMKIVNYLDLTLNLANGTYRPYHKPDNIINYVHMQSNHPPNITKQIPISIETRLSNTSCNEEVFQESAAFYNEALKRSGYNHQLKFQPHQQQQATHNRNRKRKIIWFNPPYHKNLTTNIGKFFFHLIQKHFPIKHKFNKIFNKNNIKLSYSCMPNMNTIINSHNNKIINPPTPPTNQRTCNCMRKDLCPMNQNCLASNVVYEATITSDLPNYGEKKYIGLCETAFKKRYASHKTSFVHQKYKGSTTLSMESWRIKEQNGNPNISWKILQTSRSFSPESVSCQLCQEEKYQIAIYPENNLLNKRTEIVAKCRHMNKFYLATYDSRD